MEEPSSICLLTEVQRWFRGGFPFFFFLRGFIAFFFFLVEVDNDTLTRAYIEQPVLYVLSSFSLFVSSAKSQWVLKTRREEEKKK